MSAPQITVVTLAFRPGGFDVVSKALAAQVGAPPFEYVIVDELWRWRSVACGDRLAALPFRVKHLPTERSLFPVSSTMRAGNTALRHAEGVLVVYCCDYASPPPDFLAKHWASYQANPKSFGVASYRMREVAGWCASVRAVDVYEELIAGLFPSKLLWSYFEREPEMLPPVHEHNPESLDDWCAHYKVDSVPREAILEVNGWDEEYDGVYAYGDVDMTVRLRLAGWSPRLVDTLVDIYDAHRVVLRTPEAAYRDYDAPRLLARTQKAVENGKYRCDFGFVTTVEGRRRTLAYLSANSIVLNGKMNGDPRAARGLKLYNRPWLGCPTMYMLPADCFVWEHVRPPILLLADDTMRLRDAADDPASSFCVDTPPSGESGSVVTAGPDFAGLSPHVAPRGRLVYKGDHDGGNTLITWAEARGWAVICEEFGEALCGVAAARPAS